MKFRIETPLGWRVWAIGIVLVGLVNLGLGDFSPGQPVPDWFPGRTPFAYATNALMVVAGAAVLWRPATVRATAVVTAYYAIVIVIVMNGSVWITAPAVYGPYESIAIQLAIPAAGLIVWAKFAEIDPRRAALLTRIGQGAFGLCCLIFGGAHFVYMDMTAPLVPKWLPPSQVFWGYATGVAHIAGGIAILTRIRARLAAILLAAMYACFSLLVHIPLLLGDPHRPFFWTENALNIALIGCAWVVADSLTGARKAEARLPI